MNKFDEQERKLYGEIVEAIINNDSEKVNRLKYEILFYASNLLDIITSYIFLCYIGVKFDFGSRIIKRGTKLYRIRRFDSDTNFQSEKEWSYPPLMPENRANRKDEPALYLGTTEFVCLLETNIQEGDLYVLGEYETIEDIVVGGFLESENNKIKSRYLLGVILNAFLIAPSRGDKNKKLFEFLDKHYEGLTINDIKINDAHKIDLPLKFGTINRKEEFYNVTNILLDSIKAKHKEGINYSSCYLPVSTIDIECSDSNIVLYKEGMKKIKFNGFQIKKSTRNYTGMDILKFLVKSSQKE